MKTFYAFLLLAFVSSFSFSPASARNKSNKGKLQVHPYFAAVCVSLSKRCNWFYEKYSGGCLQKTSFWKQPQECVEQVCPWCTRWKKRSTKFPCGARRVMKLCNMTGNGYVGPTPAMFQSPSNSVYPERTMDASPDMDSSGMGMDMEPTTAPASMVPSPSMSTMPSYSVSMTPSASVTPAPSMSSSISATTTPSYSASMSPSSSASITPSSSSSMMPSYSSSMVPSMSASMSASPEAPRLPNGHEGKCVWTGDDDSDKVVIDLGKVPLGEGWDRISRTFEGTKYNGIIFNRSPVKGISPPGMYGKMCFKVRAPMTGNYYFTAISYAPHNTEHNDVWVENEYGFELWKWGDKGDYAKPGKWLKAYQNNGKRGMSEHFKTVDHNGHRFIIPNVKRNKMFSICIAGRSKKYEMYQLLLIKCEDMYCKGGIMKGLFGLKASQCL